MRWIAKVACLASVVCIIAGCTQQCFVVEPDFDHYHRLVPETLENDPYAGQPDIQREFAGPPPATIDDPEKLKPWHLSLAEAVAIALENGTTGVQNAVQPGNLQDNLLSLQQIQGIGFSSDSNRVLALNPAIAGAAIEANLAKFDAKWVTEMLWSYTDQQVQGLGSFQNGQRADFRSGIHKPLPTGGLAGITFSTNYTNLTDPPQFFQIQNPAYLSRLDFTFEHPLGRDFGVFINQLLSRHPGVNPNSALNAITGAGAGFVNGHIAGISQAGFGADGILIARLRFDQSRAEFERVVNHKLLNVEAAYWNLYAAYVSLYAEELGLKQAHLLWRVLASQEAIGVVSKGDVGRAQGQYELFRGNRVQALGRVLEAERVLRGLLGLPANDGKRLIPVDAPTLAPYQPDWYSAVEESLRLRPELIALRDELKAQQFNLIVQKNFLKPDLRFVSRYGVSGLGSRLDGNGSVFDASGGRFRSNNAFRNLSSTNFNDWNLGFTLNVPLGYRFEHAAVRRARLVLAQGFLGLKNEERKAVRFLAKTYRDVIENYQLIKIRRAQRESFSAYLEKLLRREDIGALKKVEGGQLNDLLQAQRDFVNAINQEAQAVAAYNNALASFQFAKGTLLQHNNVHISEGPLPQCAQVRAVEHERERSKALVLRERSMPVKHTPLIPGCADCGLPELPVHRAPSIPALIEGAAKPNSMPSADYSSMAEPQKPREFIFDADPVIGASATTKFPIQNDFSADFGSNGSATKWNSNQDGGEFTTRSQNPSQFLPSKRPDLPAWPGAKPKTTVTPTGYGAPSTMHNNTSTLSPQPMPLTPPRSNSIYLPTTSTETQTAPATPAAAGSVSAPWPN